MVSARALAPLLLLAVGACTDGNWAVTTNGDLTTRTGTANTGNNGVANITVPVESGDEAFLVHVTAAGASEWPSAEAIRTPQGAQVLTWSDWYGEFSLTAGIYPEAQDSMINWPVRAADGPLTPGDWTVGYAVTDDDGNYLPNVDLDVVIHTRKDSDGLSAGTIKVKLLYAEGVDQDAEAVAGTEAAVERWREIWATYGLELVVDTASSAADPDLTGLEAPDADVLDASSDAADNELVMLVGETIDGSLDYLGIAGGIPGPLAESARGAIVVSWLANAGPDGRFSDDDIRLYGETLAHEVGHYTGLFHPVEDGWSAWDALDDTDFCDSNSCETVLGDNLMFPYPVCGFDSCTPQDALSASQAGVMHRYTGTL